MASKSYYDNTSVIDEAIRTLRTNISFSSTDNKLKSLLITSTNPNEGKTSITLMLARSMALNGQKILLIDCDLRNPSVGKQINVTSDIGITNFLVQNTTQSEIVIKDEVSYNLDIILTGPIPPNPSELLGSQKMENFIHKAEEIYDLVIIDSPPAGLLTDAQILSTIVDATVLVIAQGETKREELQVTLQNLNNVEANILGIVFNKVKSKKNKSYGYGYHSKE
ncbi:CpsD/CapB family tyrosine-protein kinase [Lagierella sp.]|uniref:CpsD/CapB family tyrosine-protein kinase n=1 Tax=Lagierella sp. TaxID=2849657 RepID=UPI0026146B2F|nr:CpsD/CapB family tyrosine-protein kinase [Lagierella sp.]